MKILLVEDHPLLREGTKSMLAAIPDLFIIGEAASLADARSLAERHRPSLVILDIQLPDGSGFDFIRWARRYLPEIRVLILSGYDFPQYLRAAIRLGVAGYLHKSADPDMVIATILAIGRGERVFPPELGVVANPQESSSPQCLGQMVFSDREHQVIRLVAAGQTNAAIAAQLRVSGKTVEFHLTKIYRKVGIQNRSELIRWAMRAKQVG
jgi:DNA-binding NarL/FixJ family response regulator